MVLSRVGNYPANGAVRLKDQRVKARMAYVQVPNAEGTETHLNLVWKVSPPIPSSFRPA